MRKAVMIERKRQDAVIWHSTAWNSTALNRMAQHSSSPEFSNEYSVFWYSVIVNLLMQENYGDNWTWVCVRIEFYVWFYGLCACICVLCMGECRFDRVLRDSCTQLCFMIVCW